MSTTTLRRAAAFLCIAGAMLTPAAAGGSSSLGLLGGSSNETPSTWFVELSSPPAAKGTSKAKLKAERDAFKSSAAADGIRLTERFAYDSLWTSLSVSAAMSQLATLQSIPGVKAVYPVSSISLPAEESE